MRLTAPLAVAAIIMIATTSYADTLHSLYGGVDAGSSRSYTETAFSNEEWVALWVEHLGGEPPELLDDNQIGLMSFSSFPGHIMYFEHDTSPSGRVSIRCHQDPLPSATSHTAPAAWAAGIFTAIELKLENCP